MGRKLHGGGEILPRRESPCCKATAKPTWCCTALRGLQESSGLRVPVAAVSPAAADVTAAASGTTAAAAAAAAVVDETAVSMRAKPDDAAVACDAADSARSGCCAIQMPVLLPRGDGAAQSVIAGAAASADVPTAARTARMEAFEPVGREDNRCAVLASSRLCMTPRRT